MLADEDLRPDGQGDGVLEMRADRQHGMARSRSRTAQGARELNGQRGIAAGAAQNQFAPRHQAHDGIVHMPDDGAVMDQKEIGDAAKAVQGLVFVGADGFIAQVAAGGHDGKAEGGKQQMILRGVGEHYAEVGIVGGERGGEGKGGRRGAGSAGAAEQDDGGFGRLQEPFLER